VNNLDSPVKPGNDEKAHLETFYGTLKDDFSSKIV
jgi:hypothetical protein